MVRTGFQSAIYQQVQLGTELFSILVLPVFPGLKAHKAVTSFVVFVQHRQKAVLIGSPCPDLSTYKKSCHYIGVVHTKPGIFLNFVHSLMNAGCYHLDQGSAEFPGVKEMAWKETASKNACGKEPYTLDQLCLKLQKRHKNSRIYFQWKYCEITNATPTEQLKQNFRIHVFSNKSHYVQTHTLNALIQKFHHPMYNRSRQKKKLHPMLSFYFLSFHQLV